MREKEWKMIARNYRSRSRRRRREMPVVPRRRGGGTFIDLIPHRGGRPEHVQARMAEIAREGLIEADCHEYEAADLR